MICNRQYRNELIIDSDPYPGVNRVKLKLQNNTTEYSIILNYNSVNINSVTVKKFNEESHTDQVIIHPGNIAWADPGFWIGGPRIDERSVNCR